MAGRENPGRRDEPEPGLPVISAVEEFDVFYRRELPGVLTLCYALTRRPPHAEEIAQEAFFRAYRDWGRVGRMEHRDRWVRRVALNLCYSRLRRWGAEGRALLRLRPQRHVEPDLSPETAFYWERVRALPVRQAQVIALAYLEDRPTDEIAFLLGISESTVRVHLARARAALAASLEEGEQ
jgi:RNA polymerase sigma-70 factor (ECF subfamily)